MNDEQIADLINAPEEPKAQPPKVKTPPPIFPNRRTRRSMVRRALKDRKLRERKARTKEANRIGQGVSLIRKALGDDLRYHPSLVSTGEVLRTSNSKGSELMTVALARQELQAFTGLYIKVRDSLEQRERDAFTAILRKIDEAITGAEALAKAKP